MWMLVRVSECDDVAEEIAREHLAKCNFRMHKHFVRYFVL